MSDNKSSIDWTKVHTLFREGLGIDLAQRECWLEQVAGDDPALREQLQKLLGADAQNQENAFLDQNDATLQWLVGKYLQSGTIGPYEIIEQIGSGGFGIVFKATRRDAVAETFALKIIYPWAIDISLYKRFKGEQAAMERIDHPNVARFIHSGEENGLPYMVMQYIDGKSLDQMLMGTNGTIDCVQVPLATRVQWFRMACNGVAAAHQQLILHRDLKPGNILIDRQGQAVITDFGLAKNIDPMRKVSDLTTQGRMMGTLPFMSPEQVKGEKELQLASDVYGLGALLYFLMTGQPPHRRSSLNDLCHAICEEQPISPRQIDSSIPRDLETICLHCLNKSPSRRYSSAESLRDDVDRYLSEMPVAARPIGNLERFSYWIRRRPAVAGLSAAIIVGTAANLIVITSLWSRATRNYESAKLNNQQLLATIQQVAKHIRIAETDPTTITLQAEMLRTVTSSYDALASECQIDRQFLHDAGVAWFKLSAVENETGNLSARDAALVRAEYYFREIIRRGEGDVSALFDLFHTLHRQGSYHPENLELYEEVLATIEQVVALDTTGNVYYLDALSEALRSMASRKHKLGQAEEAISLLERGAKIAEKLVLQRPDVAMFHLKVGTYAHFHGYLAIERGALDEAFNHLRYSIQVLHTAHQRDRSNDACCVELIKSQLAAINLALVFDRTEWAEQWLIEAEAVVNDGLARWSDWSQVWWKWKGIVLDHRMLFDYAAGREDSFALSRASYEEFLQQRLDEVPDCRLALPQMASLISDPSLTSNPDLDRALEMAKAAANNPRIRESHGVLGTILYRCGQWHEALDEFEKYRQRAKQANPLHADAYAFVVEAIRTDLSSDHHPPRDESRPQDAAPVSNHSPDNIAPSEDLQYLALITFGSESYSYVHTRRNFEKYHAAARAAWCRVRETHQNTLP